RILLLTFTRRAAREMLHRLEKNLREDTHHLTAGTFHHFCLQIMRRIPKTFAVADSTIIDRDDAQSLIQLIRGELIKKGQTKDFPRAATLLNYFSYARNCCLSLEDYLLQFTELDDDFLKLTLQIGEQYQQRKQQRHYLDYDDILFRFVETLDNN